MQKVSDYKIVLVRRIRDLETQVRQSISEGWVPSGPVIVLDDNEEFGQVMVKFEEA